MADLVGRLAVAVRRVLAARTAVVVELHTAAAELHNLIEVTVRHIVPAEDLQELRIVVVVRRMVAGSRMGLVEERHIGLEEVLVVRRIAGEEHRRVVVVMGRHIVLVVDREERRIAAVAVRRVVAGHMVVVEGHHTAVGEGTGLLVRRMAVGCKTLRVRFG